MTLTPLMNFKNRHQNTIGLICGSAPSLNDIDFTRISKDIIIFACNQSVVTMSKCHYFCLGDHGVAQNLPLFEYGASIADQIMCLADLTRSITLHPSYAKFQSKITCIERGDNKCWNLDSENLIRGVDVIHITAHLAHIMGCTPLLLAGVDLTYQNNKLYCDSTVYPEVVHWNHTSSMPFFDDVLLGWKELQKTNPKIDFRNLSPNGRLKDLFPTVSHDVLYAGKDK